jgi:hypothetical protein
VATYYVDSNATGLNDGSSWTDAWTSITSITAVSAGDTVLVSDAHSETTSSVLNPPSTISNPVKIISTSTSSNSYSAGASVAGVSFDGSVIVHGLSITSTGVHYFNWASHGSSSYEDCNLTINHICRFASTNAKFLNCTWDQSAGSVKHEFWENTELIFDNCEILTRSGGENRFFYARGFKANIVFRCCNIGSFTYLIESFSGQWVSISIIKCNHNITNLFEVDDQYGVSKVTNSGTGAITNPALGNSFVSASMESSTVSTVYRNSGASDGFSDYSLKIVSGSIFYDSRPINAEINKYVESGSQTITVYVAGSSSLNDDDFWIEVESPSEEVSPTAQGKFRTTKPDPLATPTALTSDTSSAWNGSGVGTKQKVEVAISPTIAGTVTVRCYLAKPSTTVYVDPKISAEGKQRVFNGVLVDGETVLCETTPVSTGTQIYPFRQWAQQDPELIIHPLRSN